MYARDISTFVLSFWILGVYCLALLSPSISTLSSILGLGLVFRSTTSLFSLSMMVCHWFDSCFVLSCSALFLASLICMLLIVCFSVLFSCSIWLYSVFGVDSSSSSCSVSLHTIRHSFSCCSVSTFSFKSRGCVNYIKHSQIDSNRGCTPLSNPKVQIMLENTWVGSWDPLKHRLSGVLSRLKQAVLGQSNKA